MPKSHPPLIAQSFLWTLAWRNLWRQGRRSGICLLTIAMGVMCLLLFEGFNQGALWEYQERVVHTRIGHFQIEKIAEGALTTDVAELLFESNAQIEEVIRRNPDVLDVFPRLRISGLLTTDKKTIPTIAEGIDPSRENAFFNELEYLHGGALTAEDQSGTIIGLGVAQALGLEIGSRVTLLTNTLSGSINAVDLEVRGIFRSGVKEFDETLIRLPLAAAQDLLQTQGISTLVVGLKNSELMEGSQAYFKMNPIEGFKIADFIELDDVYYGNAVRWLEAQFMFIRLIIYLVVIMGILNTVIITVHERRPEIGTLRAMGFGRKFVLRGFLREYALLGVLGGVLGVTAGFLVAKVFLLGGVPMPPSPGATKGLQVMLRIGTDVVFWNFVAAVLCSVVAAFFPVRSALKEDVVSCLQVRV